MKKILHITLKLSFGGMGKMISSWVHNIDKEKFSCDLVHQGIVNEYAQKQADELQAIGCNIYAMTYRYRQVLKRYNFIKDIIKANKYDVVHVHTSSPFDIILLMAAKHCGVKTRIMHSHNSNPQLYSVFKKITGAMTRLFIKRYATHILACSREAGYSLFGRNKYSIKNIIVLKNGVDAKLFRYDKLKRKEMREELGIDKKHVFGHIGRFSEQKNHFFLIDIFNEIIKLNKESILILIGDGELKVQCEKKAISLDLQEKILFLGNKYNVPDYLQAMDTFLFPSLWEGFSVVFIEMQCSGLACLASEAIVDEAVIINNVIKYNLYITAKEWAKKAISLFNDDETRKNAYLEVEKSGLSIKNNLEVLENIYSQTN